MYYSVNLCRIVSRWWFCLLKFVIAPYLVCFSINIEVIQEILKLLILDMFIKFAFNNIS